MSLNPLHTEQAVTLIEDSSLNYSILTTIVLGLPVGAEIISIVLQLKQLSAEMGIPIHEVTQVLSKEQLQDIALFLPGVIVHMFETYPPLALIPVVIFAIFIVSLDVRNWNTITEGLVTFKA